MNIKEIKMLKLGSNILTDIDEKSLVIRLQTSLIQFQSIYMQSDHSTFLGLPLYIADSRKRTTHL